MVNNGTKVEKWNQNDLKVGQNRPKIGSRLKMDSKSSGNQLEIRSRSTQNRLKIVSKSTQSTMKSMKKTS